MTDLPIDIDAEIMKIRNQALKDQGLGEHLECPVCGKTSAMPYRRYDRELNVVEGCVDAFHTDGLLRRRGRTYSANQDWAWHMRDDAKQLRRREYERLLTIRS
jgi:ketosteroid isomerase-like protein